jgi:hypothetical protein
MLKLQNTFKKFPIKNEEDKKIYANWRFSFVYIDLNDKAHYEYLEGDINFEDYYYCHINHMADPIKWFKNHIVNNNKDYLFRCLKAHPVEPIIRDKYIEEEYEQTSLFEGE